MSPGDHLFPPPEHWDCKHGPPWLARTFLFLPWVLGLKLRSPLVLRQTLAKHTTSSALAQHTSCREERGQTIHCPSHFYHALTFCWSNKSHTVSASDLMPSLEAGNAEYLPNAASSRQPSFLFSCVNFRCYWFSVWIFYGLANLLPPSSPFLPPPSLLNAVTSQHVLETIPSVFIFMIL